MALLGCAGRSGHKTNEEDMDLLHQSRECGGHGESYGQLAPSLPYGK